MSERKYLSFVVVTGIFALVLAFIGNSFAQPTWMNAPAGEMQKEFMKGVDKNGDGKVTRDEFRGPDSHWKFFDKNKDGFIEISEAPTPDNMPDMSNAPKAKGEGDGAKPASVQVPADAKPLYGKDFIKKFDFDKDGKVNHDEWEGIKPMTVYANNRWPEFDKNEDGFITLDETPQPK